MSSASSLNHIRVEKISVNSSLPLSNFPMLGFVDFVMLHLFIDLVTRTFKFFSRYRSCIQSQYTLLDSLKVQPTKKRQPTTFNDRVDDGILYREDAEMVMERLGIFSHPEDEKLEALQESFVRDDLSKLFDEKEPSLEEIKDAFDVFDENRDGFIDAGELQRVLCALGFEEGLEIENCQMMICAFDEDDDGRIDFKDFVNLMEKGIC